MSEPTDKELFMRILIMAIIFLILGFILIGYSTNPYMSSATRAGYGIIGALVLILGIIFLIIYITKPEKSRQKLLEAWEKKQAKKK